MNRSENEKLLREFLQSLGITDVFKSGTSDLSACCPFHDDNKPSFCVSFNPRKWGLWVCYGCGEKGTFLDLNEALDGNPDYQPKQLKLKDKIKNIFNETDPNKIVELPSPTLLGEKQAVEYLVQYRNYENETAEELTRYFKIYQGSGKWKKYLIIPVCSPSGEKIGFTSRNLTSQGPKTLHPSGCSKANWLLGANVCLDRFGNDATILTEGPFDAFRLHAYGCPGVATLGPPTTDQIQTAHSLFGKVYTAFDGDLQGKEYQQKTSRIIPCANLQLPYKKDPDELKPNQWKRIWENKKEPNLPQKLKAIFSDNYSTVRA